METRTTFQAPKVLPTEALHSDCADDSALRLKRVRHDLRNRFTAILAAVQLLRSGDDPLACRGVRLLDVIRDNTKQAADLLTALEVEPPSKAG